MENVKNYTHPTRIGEIELKTAPQNMKKYQYYDYCGRNIQKLLKLLGLCVPLTIVL